MNHLQDILSICLPPDPEKLDLKEISRDVCGHALLYKLKETKSLLYDWKWDTCKSNCNHLQDITWEYLNTGHWKDVHDTWRYIYSYVCLFKAICEYAEDSNNLQTVVKTCDMGLLMGAPILDNVLTKFVKILNKVNEHHKIVSGAENKVDHRTLVQSDDNDEQLLCPPKRRKEEDININISYPSISKKHEIISISCPSVEHFKLKYMDTATPVVLKDCMSFWPAMSSRRWDLQYIRSVAGLRTVPVEIGARYTDDSWSQKLMSVDEFIKKYIENPSEEAKGYLAQHPLFDQIPELQDDIIIPTYCCLGESEEVDINAWFGPEGTISPLHQDPKHNFLAQIVGEKYIKLYTVDQTQCVYPYTEGLLTNTSQVDVENPDLIKFPKFSSAKPVECILRPGDLLYIPVKCWHYVRSLSVSFSVSFWWE